MSEHRAFSASAALLDLKRVAGRARIRTAAARELATVVAGGGIAQLGRELVLRVHRYEHIEPPAALAVGATSFDVGRDLVNYTGLPPDEVDRLLRRRSDSFRAEWYTTPRKRRLDAWFYLASSTYLFGNAVHDPLPQLKLLRDRGIRPGRALDFGGGTGNLALAMAAAGWTVDYLEHSALQKDFVAYRLNAYGFADRVRVLDDWRPIAAETYDLVVAIDVLEHVADLERLLTESLLPAIRDGGRLLESSPFVQNVSNPMHHEHKDFESTLENASFLLEHSSPEGRLWRRGTGAR